MREVVGEITSIQWRGTWMYLVSHEGIKYNIFQREHNVYVVTVISETNNNHFQKKGREAL